MWEDNGRRKFIINTVLALLIVALIAALFLTMRHIQRQNEEKGVALSEIQTQQKQQLSESRAEEAEALELEYQKDMDTVQKYVPGIVCWGDTNTPGSYNNVSYPVVLKKYIETYITDVYDFSSTLDNPGRFASMRWSKYKFTIPVVNMSAGIEDTNTVLGRCGVVPYVTKGEFTIPAGIEPVELKLVSSNGNDVFPMQNSGDIGINEVTIAGVKGCLSYESTAMNKSNPMGYFFTRSEEGEEVLVPDNTVVETDVADKYKDYIHVISIGSYGGFDRKPEVLVEQVKQLLQRQTSNSDRYIVVGLWAMEGKTALYSAYYLDSVDEAMMQAFGSHYINIRNYLCSDGVQEAKLSLTSDDKYAIRNSVVPPSFLTNSNVVELNSAAQKLLGKQIFTRMERLGYFDEIYDELGIEDSVKDIQKDDPKYFEDIIETSF